MSYQELYEENARLKAELAELKRLVFGRKTERFVPQAPAADQLNLFVQHPQEEAQQKTVKEVVKGYERQKGQPKREKLPEGLPVVEVEINPAAEEIAGMVRIGQEVTEELDYVPARFRVIRYIRPKYARPESEQDQDPEAKNILIAPLPTRVIEKGIPSAGLLAHILISKFVDHLPYYRQIKMFARIGMKISDSTINGWVTKCVALLQVLYEWHKLRMMESDYLMADETTIKVLQEGKPGKSHTGYFWVYYDPGGKRSLFVYDPGRGGKYPREHLKNFKGHLQTDGYAGYEAFDQLGSDKRLVGCMAHVRRKFEHALDNDAQRAGEVLKIMQRLYAIEQQARQEGYTHEQRLELRRKQATPIMQELKNYLLQAQDRLLPKSKIGQAVNYALNRWKYLERYVEDGKLEIDNNLVENAIRLVALGRKNYLFAGSPQGAGWAAVLYTLLSSAQGAGHNPFEYLKDILQRLPDQPLSELDELLPQHWTPLDTGMVRVTEQQGEV
ncbi:MAG: IS66 family transposase [Saprospiraceae bacterium]|nr:IS66 family transposase [Saprospiraceae bacterium]